MRGREKNLDPAPERLHNAIVANRSLKNERPNRRGRDDRKKKGKISLTVGGDKELFDQGTVPISSREKRG